jgi:hypothetical protein
VAIANYSDLVSAIGDWLARSDLSARSPDFIALAEARFRRELRVREMLEQTTGSIATNSLGLPGDFLEVHRFTLDTASDLPLEYRPIEDVETRYAGVISGVPVIFTILGSNLILYPTPDGSYDYTLDYYAAVPALTAANTTNWLLTNAPDLYLFSALAEAESFLQNDDRIAIWKDRADMAMRGLNLANQRAARSNAPRRQRVLV